MDIQVDYGIYEVVLSNQLSLSEMRSILDSLLEIDTDIKCEQLKNKTKFRIMPIDHFIDKQITNIKIGPKIIVRYGILKPDIKHTNILKGSGFLDIVRSGVNKVQNIFSIREDFNNISKKTMMKYGDLPIIKLEVARHPIPRPISFLVDYITNGAKAFDKLFHLQLIATVEGGINIGMEKLEVVTVHTTFQQKSDRETMNVPLNGKHITINEMLHNAYKAVGPHLMFSYNGLTNNCQFFVSYLLKNVGLYSEPVKNFVFQDLSALIEKTPYFYQQIMNTTTTTGALINKWLGKGRYDKFNN